MLFQEMLNINENQLVDEWKTYPSHVFSIGKEYAQLTMERDELKDRLDLAKSEVYTRIKTDPASFNITDPKPTEAYISATIAQSDEVVNLLVELHQKQHDASIAKAALTAAECKMAALENITKLFLATGQHSSTNQFKNNKEVQIPATPSAVMPIRRKTKTNI